MIQAPLLKTIETPKAKAPQADASRVSTNSKGPKAFATKEAKASKAKEFAKELETLTNESNVKPVKVSGEQTLELPSSLVRPSGSVETTSTKVFDPALTKGVENLIQPKTAEVSTLHLTDAQVIELADAKPQMGITDLKGEVVQAMLKTPQTAQVTPEIQTPVPSGRTPAIEFAKAEIDPQLLNNEDFLAQKNLTSKKSAPNAYGMKQFPSQKQEALEQGLKQAQVIKEANLAEGTTSSETGAMNSQQFILGLQSEAKSQLSETQAPQKIFDMSNIKSSQPNEIMNQITDYVVQAKAAKEPTVNMRVNHEELGMIDITVSKTGFNQEAISVNIGTHTVDGKNFFLQNSKDLMSHLTTSGMNISDLKVETPTQTSKNDFDFGSQGGRNGQPGSEKQFGSEQNQRRHEQERRQDLWKLLNKEAA